MPLIDATTALFKGKMVRNFVSMAAAQSMSAVLGFIAVVYLARTLDQRLFGIFAFAQTLAAYLALASDMGLHMAGINGIASDPSRTRMLVSSISTLRLLLAACAFGLFAAVVSLIGRPAGWNSVMLVFMLSLFPQAAFLDWAFRGLQSMGSTGLAVLLKSAVFLAAAVLLVRESGALMNAAWSWVLSSAVMSVFLWAVFVRRFGAVAPCASPSAWKSLLSSGLPLGLSFILLQLYQNMNVFLIGVLPGNGEVEVAMYSAAARVVLFFFFIASSFGFALEPVIAEMVSGRAGGPPAVKPLLGGSLRFCLYLSAPAAVAGCLMAEEIMVFIYGGGYAGAAPAFRIIILQVPAVFAGVSFSQVLMAFGRGKAVLFAACAGAAVNAVLGFALIPGLGIEGASYAVLAAELAMETLLIVFALKSAVPGNPLPVILAVAGASAAMAAAAVCSGGHVLFRLALAAAVYAAALAVLDLAGRRFPGTNRSR